MKHVALKSSMISSVGYDLEKKHLEIVFTSKATYRYLAPCEEFIKLINSDFPSIYFNEHIKHHYKYYRVD